MPNKQIIDLIEIAGASLLMTIMFLLTKKSWAGGAKLSIIFFGGIIAGHFFSTIPAYYIPEVYESVLGTAIRGGSTIIGFLFLLYAFEKNIFDMFFKKIVDSEINKIPTNNKE